MDYSKRVREFRVNRGLKAKFVAERTGLSSTQYCALEKGRKKLTADLAVKLADVFGVSLNDLLCPQVSGTLTKREAR